MYSCSVTSSFNANSTVTSTYLSPTRLNAWSIGNLSILLQCLLLHNGKSLHFDSFLLQSFCDCSSNPKKHRILSRHHQTGKVISQYDSLFLPAIGLYPCLSSSCSIDIVTEIQGSGIQLFESLS